MADETLDLFQKYQDELKKDITVDELNMKEVALHATSVKHKWAGRLMRHKIELSKIEKARDKALGILCERLGENPALQLSSAAIRRKAELDPQLEPFDKGIEQGKMIVEYLEKVEKIVTSLTWDLKNIVEMVKLETQ
jgi:hypothetical protein